MLQPGHRGLNTFKLNIHDRSSTRKWRGGTPHSIFRHIHLDRSFMDRSPQTTNPSATGTPLPCCTYFSPRLLRFSPQRESLVPFPRYLLSLTRGSANDDAGSLD
ncbi:hypothetical protein AVEN_61549-1 [Araneus ventricosus]|uniref:Uncharacterized protein n=1 Tax=Araneus ventricosus TaxID=182803 RepID=A0A4Y2R1T8_ARAVE|nr:hypothetical protein AVEN_61549-1 [Araneus ventricosus]